MKRSLLVLFLFLTLIPYCVGQKSDNVVLQIVDSLDRIHLDALNDIKPKGRTCVIRVKDQKQFVEMNERIVEAIRRGKRDIRVRISPGTYVFHENHIFRSGDYSPEVSISLIGKRTVITAEDAINFSKSEPWTDLIKADSLIVVVEEESKLCFIPYKNDIEPAQYANYTKIKISQWFSCPSYDIHHIDKNGIFFYASNLTYKKQYGREGYTINYDYLYSGQSPRFKLYDKQHEHECEASVFVNLSDCVFRSFTIKGINFIGNKKGQPLLSVGRCRCKLLSVTDCSFERINGKVLNATGTNNIRFSNNTIQNTAGDEICFSKGCNNVEVTHNYFKNCGKDVRQTFCVNCGESVYRIANNVFCDFGYSAIGVGIWYGHEKAMISKGIIEYNEIFFSSEYYSNFWKYMLMDSGAIYTWTKNDDVIMRYNYIHDYIGAGDNRGVFCDDGASNLNIYGNIIINIPNSYCIDSRLVKDQNAEVRNNSNNFIARNVVDGRMRIMGYDEENRHVIKGPNLFLHRKGSSPVENRFDFIDTNYDDDVIKKCGYDAGVLIVDKTEKQLLDSYISEPYLKQIFKNRSK